MSAAILILLSMAAGRPSPAVPPASPAEQVVSGIPATSANARRVDALLTALGALAFADLSHLLAPDAVLELPFAGEGLRVTGREAIIEHLRQTMGRQLAGLKFTVTARYTATEPGVQIVELASHGQLRSGSEFTNRLIAIVRIRAGKVTLFREYFNPAPLRQPAG